ncbi:hypothetical protein [Desulfurobacterium sp.]
MSRFKVIVFAFLLALSLHFRVFASTNPYTAIPPFLQQGKYANIMLVLDFSGSMSNYAYRDFEYNSSKTYIGYFIPDAKYKYSYSGMRIFYRDKNGAYTGNYLNYSYMAKLDILKWILTGGGPVVTSTTREKYLDLGGIYIPIKDVSTYNPKTGRLEGILQKIEKLSEHPRIGLEIYALRGSSIVQDWDYPSYKYKKLIRTINREYADGGTPTGEALDEVKRYFSRQNGVWGGFKKTDSKYIDPYKFKIKGTLMDVHCTKNYFF